MSIVNGDKRRIISSNTIQVTSAFRLGPIHVNTPTFLYTLIDKLGFAGYRCVTLRIRYV